MPQLRACMPQLKIPHATSEKNPPATTKIPCAATKTQHSQINNKLKKKKTWWEETGSYLALHSLKCLQDIKDIQVWSAGEKSGLKKKGDEGKGRDSGEQYLNQGLRKKKGLRTMGCVTKPGEECVFRKEGPIVSEALKTSTEVQQEKQRQAGETGRGRARGFRMPG